MASEGPAMPNKTGTVPFLYGKPDVHVPKLTKQAIWIGLLTASIHYSRQDCIAAHCSPPEQTGLGKPLRTSVQKGLTRRNRAGPKQPHMHELAPEGMGKRRHCRRAQTKQKGTRGSCAFLGNLMPRPGKPSLRTILLGWWHSTDVHQVSGRAQACPVRHLAVQ